MRTPWKPVGDCQIQRYAAKRLLWDRYALRCRWVWGMHRDGGHLCHSSSIRPCKRQQFPALKDMASLLEHGSVGRVLCPNQRVASDRRLGLWMYETVVCVCPRLVNFV